MKKNNSDELKSNASNMQKEKIIQTLKEKGYRITKQRRILIDIILKNEFSCCKEIYSKASRVDKKIGTATVYRMINTLEEIGAIDRKNMYKISCDECPNRGDACLVELDDSSVFHLDEKNWMDIIYAGMKEHGYIDNQKINKIIVTDMAGL